MSPFAPDPKPPLRRPDDAERARIRRRRRSRAHPCPFCKTEQRMFWRCGCGFEICPECMDENAWGLTCNHITWTCPDCGRQNSF